MVVFEGDPTGENVIDVAVAAVDSCSSDLDSFLLAGLSGVDATDDGKFCASNVNG